MTTGTSGAAPKPPSLDALVQALETAEASKSERGLYIVGTEFKVLDPKTAKKNGAVAVTEYEFGVWVEYAGKADQVKSELNKKNVKLIKSRSFIPGFGKKSQSDTFSDLLGKAMNASQNSTSDADVDAFGETVDTPVNTPVSQITAVTLLHHSLEETSRLTSGDTRLIQQMESDLAKLPDAAQRRERSMVQTMRNHYALATDPSRQPYAVLQNPERRIPQAAGSYVVQPGLAKDGSYTLYVRGKKSGEGKSALETYRIEVQTSGQIKVTGKEQKLYDSWQDALQDTGAKAPAPQPTRAVRHLDAHLMNVDSAQNNEAYLTERLGARILVCMVDGNELSYIVKPDTDQSQLLINIDGTEFRAPTLYHLLKAIHEKVGFTAKPVLLTPKANGVDDYFHQEVLADMIDNDSQIRLLDPRDNPILSRRWVATPAGPQFSLYSPDMTAAGKAHFIAKGSFNEIADTTSRSGPMVISEVRSDRQVDLTMTLRVIEECRESDHVLTGYVVTSPEGKVGILNPLAKGDAASGAFRNENRATRFAAIHDAAKGVAYLHSTGLVWRDAKPENILVFKDQPSKTNDWDTACEASKEFTGPVGTPLYMSPQAANPAVPVPAGQTKAVDTFSMGLSIWEMYTKKRLADSSISLQKGEDQFKFLARRQQLSYSDLEAGGLPTEEDAKRDPMLALIREMCNPQDPDARPSMNEVVQRLNQMPDTVKGINPPLPPKNDSPIE